MKYITMSPEQLQAIVAIRGTKEGKIFLNILKDAEIKALGSSVVENDIHCRWMQGRAMELAELIMAFDKSSEELGRRNASAILEGA